MLKIVESKNELTLRDYPIIPVLVGAGLTLLGCVLLSAEYSFIYQSLSTGNFGNTELVRIVFPIAIFTGGFLFIFKASVIITTINREMKTLTSESKSLLSYDYKKFRFSQIENHLSVKITTHKSTSYNPQVKVISTGEIIDVTHEGFSRPGKAYEIADLANQYLADEADKDNFKLTIINDD